MTEEWYFLVPSRFLNKVYFSDLWLGPRLVWPRILFNLTYEKPRSVGPEGVVDPLQDVVHLQLRTFVLSQDHHLELVVQILDLFFYLFVGNEEVVPARYRLHDVALDLLILQDRNAAVDLK